MSDRLRCLIAGLGNPLAGDDAVGLALLDALSERKLPDGCRLAAPRSPLELIDLLAGVEHVILLDAVSSGSSPGTLHVLPFPSPGFIPRSSLSTHGWNVTDVIALATSLGRSVPPITLVGIEVANVRMGEAMSEPVARVIGECVARIEALIGAAPSP